MKRDIYTICAGILLILVVFLHIQPVKDILPSPFALPAIWIGLIMLISFVLPRMHVPGNIGLHQYIVGYAFSGAIIFLAVGFLLGVFLGKLSSTPYDISPKGIFYNIVSLVPALSAKEFIRAYVIGTIFRKKSNSFLKAALITLIFALIEINYGKAAVLKDISAIFIYAAKDVVPVILKNVLLSVLVYYGGAKSGIVYSLVIAVFQRVFPFLPSLPWLADSAMGIAFPTLFANFLFEKYQMLKGEKAEKKKENTMGYGVTLLASVLFMWFIVGVFPVYPSVVLTGSMEPMIFPGDAVLIKKLSEEKEVYRLKEGDVINFKRENITITHRIIEVRIDGAGNISFQTKGDNNKSADLEIVKPNDIKGTIVRVVPQIGKPVLFIKSTKTIPEGVVVE